LLPTWTTPVNPDGVAGGVVVGGVVEPPSITELKDWEAALTLPATSVVVAVSL
jgi:hypothetical protein